MATCTTCFTEVDGRSAQKCSDCNRELHAECAIEFDGATFCDVCFTVKSAEPKDIFGEVTLPEVIRRTHIETYRTCPFKFYNEVLKDNPMPNNIYTLVGSDLHELFEEELRDRGKYTPESMLEAFDEQYFSKYDEVLFEMKDKEFMWQRAVDSINTFMHITLFTIPMDAFAIEEKIVFDIGSDIPDVSITMDLITEVDGELEMHDWKTGRVMVGKKHSSDLQAPLYIYAVLQHFKRPVRSFKFHYLGENKTRIFTRDDKDPDRYTCRVGNRLYHISLQDSIREVKSIFSRIQKKDFYIPQDTKPMYFACKMCHIREQGLCAGAEEESWNQMNQQ